MEIRQCTKNFKQYTFSSDFSGGNLFDVKCTNGSNVFDVFHAADCQGTPLNTGYRFWWSFCVHGFKKLKDIITITVRSASAQSKLYQQGMKPLFRIGHYGPWERIPTQITVDSSDITTSVTFSISAKTIVRTLLNRLHWGDALHSISKAVPSNHSFVASKFLVSPSPPPPFSQFFTWPNSVKDESKATIIEEALFEYLQRTTTTLFPFPPAQTREFYRELGDQMMGLPCLKGRPRREFLSFCKEKFGSDREFWLTWYAMWAQTHPMIVEGDDDNVDPSNDNDKQSKRKAANGRGVLVPVQADRFAALQPKPLNTLFSCETDPLPAFLPKVAAGQNKKELSPASTVSEQAAASDAVVKLNEIEIYFAVCFPYSVDELTFDVEMLDAVFNPSSAEGSDGNASRIYYSRESVAETPLGFTVPLLTVTQNTRSPFTLPSHLSLPVTEASPKDNSALPPILKKPVYFISSRVHPAETPASFVLLGFLRFLFRRNDPRAEFFRRVFVVKIIPILNLDGVEWGFSRTDPNGRNLNRHYEREEDDDSTPSREKTPVGKGGSQSVVASSSKTNLKETKPASIRSMPIISVPPETVISSVFNTLISQPSNSPLAFFVDLHAHASKRSCFFYGIRHHGNQQHQTGVFLYSLLMALNSPYFDLSGCIYSARMMEAKDRKGESREKCGRVAVHTMTGVVHSYTLECNYHSAGDYSPSVEHITACAKLSVEKALDIVERDRADDVKGREAMNALSNSNKSLQPLWDWVFPSSPDQKPNETKVVPTTKPLIKPSLPHPHPRIPFRTSALTACHRLTPRELGDVGVSLIVSTLDLIGIGDALGVSTSKFGCWENVEAEARKMTRKLVASEGAQLELEKEEKRKVEELKEEKRKQDEKRKKEEDKRKEEEAALAKEQAKNDNEALSEAQSKPVPKPKKQLSNTHLKSKKAAPKDQSEEREENKKSSQIDKHSDEENQNKPNNTAPKPKTIEKATSESDTKPEPKTKPKSKKKAPVVAPSQKKPAAAQSKDSSKENKEAPQQTSPSLPPTPTEVVVAKPKPPVPPQSRESTPEITPAPSRPPTPPESSRMDDDTTSNLSQLHSFMPTPTPPLSSTTNPNSTPTTPERRPIDHTRPSRTGSLVSIEEMIPPEYEDVSHTISSDPNSEPHNQSRSRSASVSSSAASSCLSVSEFSARMEEMKGVRGEGDDGNGESETVEDVEEEEASHESHHSRPVSPVLTMDPFKVGQPAVSESSFEVTVDRGTFEVDSALSPDSQSKHAQTDRTTRSGHFVQNAPFPTSEAVILETETEQIHLHTEATIQHPPKEEPTPSPSGDSDSSAKPQPLSAQDEPVHSKRGSVSSLKSSSPSTHTIPSPPPLPVKHKTHRISNGLLARHALQTDRTSSQFGIGQTGIEYPSSVAVESRPMAKEEQTLRGKKKARQNELRSIIRQESTRLLEKKADSRKERREEDTKHIRMKERRTIILLKKIRETGPVSEKKSVILSSEGAATAQNENVSEGSQEKEAKEWEEQNEKEEENSSSQDEQHTTVEAQADTNDTNHPDDANTEHGDLSEQAHDVEPSPEPVQQIDLPPTSTTPTDLSDSAEPSPPTSHTPSKPLFMSIVSHKHSPKEMKQRLLRGEDAMRSDFEMNEHRHITKREQKMKEEKVWKASAVQVDLSSELARHSRSKKKLESVNDPKQEKMGDVHPDQDSVNPTERESPDRLPLLNFAAASVSPSQSPILSRGNRSQSKLDQSAKKRKEKDWQLSPLEIDRVLTQAQHRTSTHAFEEKRAEKDDRAAEAGETTRRKPTAMRLTGVAAGYVQGKHTGRMDVSRREKELDRSKEAKTERKAEKVIENKAGQPVDESSRMSVNRPLPRPQLSSRHSEQVERGLAAEFKASLDEQPSPAPPSFILIEDKDDVVADCNPFAKIDERGESREKRRKSRSRGNSRVHSTHEEKRPKDQEADEKSSRTVTERKEDVKMGMYSYLFNRKKK